MAKNAPKGGGDARADKPAFGTTNMGEIETAATSTMEPRSFERGYDPPEHPLHNKGTFIKKGGK